MSRNSIIGIGIVVCGLVSFFVWLLLYYNTYQEENTYQIIHSQSYVLPDTIVEPETRIIRQQRVDFVFINGFKTNMCTKEIETRIADLHWRSADGHNANDNYLRYAVMVNRNATDRSFFMQPENIAKHMYYFVDYTKDKFGKMILLPGPKCLCD